jgi:hypothetical protein
LKDASETKNKKPMTSLVVVENPDIEVVMKMKRSVQAQKLLDSLTEWAEPTIAWTDWVEAFNAKLASGATLSKGTLAAYRKELTDEQVVTQVKKGVYKLAESPVKVNIEDSFKRVEATEDAA